MKIILEIYINMYLATFLAGIILNTIIVFILYKQNASYDYVRFDIRSLNSYYTMLSHLGPEWLHLPSLKSFIYGSIIAGLLALSLLLLSRLLSIVM